MINQKSKIKNQKQSLKTKSFTLCVLALIFALCTLHSNVFAVSPTVTPKLTPTPTKKLSSTPLASPSASLTPATAEDEKVQEIRDAIKEKLTQIKDKIEKKAYVGIILEITDSTLTLSNFRGKRRVRITSETKVISQVKKETTVKDLAVEDKVICLGEVDSSGTLETKRVVEVAATISVKRLVFLGTISEINSKTSSVLLTNIKDINQTLLINIDKTTNFVNHKDQKAIIKLKDLTQSQKILAVYPEPAEGKTALVKTIFLLP